MSTPKFKCAVCEHTTTRSPEATDEPVCQSCVDKIKADHAKAFPQDFVVRK